MLDIQRFTHPIKQMVVNSIEGLNYEKVSAVPFPTPVVSAAPPRFVRIIGIEVSSAYAPRFRLLVYGLFFFLCVLLVTSACLLWQKMGSAPSAEGGAQSEKGREALPV
jgi:type III secretory pathway lipoprotein EscJ